MKRIELGIKIKTLFWNLLVKNVLDDNISYKENENGILERNDDANIFIDLNKFDFEIPNLRGNQIININFDLENLVFKLENDNEIKFNDLNKNELLIINN